MRKIFLLILLINFSAENLLAQSKDTVINNIVKAISNFQIKERKRDSVLNHPLGSNKEEDFLRRFDFYDSVNKELNFIKKVQIGRAHV